MTALQYHHRNGHHGPPPSPSSLLGAQNGQSQEYSQHSFIPQANLQPESVMQISTCFKVFPILNTCLYFYLYYLFCYSKILRKTSEKFTRNGSERKRMLLALQYWLSACKMKMLSLPKNLQWYIPHQDKSFSSVTQSRCS